MDAMANATAITGQSSWHGAGAAEFDLRSMALSIVSNAPC